MESLRSMQQWVERNDCVDMKLFLAATDVKLVSELKKRYLSDFEVVMDPIGDTSKCCG